MEIVENKKLQQLCNYLDLRIIENGHLKSSDWHYDDLTAPYNRIYIVTEGSAIININQTSYNLKKGEVYLVPMNTKFSCHTPQYLEKIFFHFNMDFFGVEDIFHNQNKLFQMAIDSEEIEKLKGLFEEGNLKSILNLYQSMFQLIFRFIEQLDLGENLLEWSGEYRQFVNLNGYIKNNLSANLKVNHLAKELHLTPSTLSKNYKRVMGKTLKSYIQSQLMNRGKLLLLTTTLSIKEIAYELQYEDPLYFSRLFKQQEGMSPKLYRKLNKI